MHIESVTLRNFRCFGEEPTTVTLGENVTALIGANGAGKSAFIEALRRLFGLTQEERTLTRSDVHFGPDESPDSIDEREIVIDAVFAFPELTQNAADAVRTVPEVFRVMTAADMGEPLKARIRLEALWRRGESFIDEIETAMYWVTHLGDVEFGQEGGVTLDKQPLLHSDRGKIQLVHVPATRDGGAVTRQALRQLLRRVERSGDFGHETAEDIQGISDSLQEKIDDLPAIAWVTERLKQNWGRLHTAEHLTNPRFVVVSQEFSQLLRSLNPRLSPGPDNRDRSLEELSEGQTSLLFLALAATLAQLESELGSGHGVEGFSDLDIAPPALTIYAVEEPENHLAPFYLSRLMGLLEELCRGNQSMGIVTSHAPGTLRRVEPEDVRHFRLDTDQLVTRVNPILLPDDEEEGAKFVRQAVLAQPEIYFASLVILGEGDSEEIVIPRVATALDIPLDPSFIAFAPLGGRHVNHFWRLLAQLDIPFLTLLDIDFGRHGAGTLRVKYAHDQLVKTRNIKLPDFVEGDPNDIEYWRRQEEQEIGKWTKWLEEQGVYYSYPLDLDMMMVQAFPDAYGAKEVDVPGSMEKIYTSVFGKGDGLSEYKTKVSKDSHPSDKELVAYDQLFKKRGKPASHLEALGKLDDEDIAQHCPRPLHQLLKTVARMQQRSAEERERQE